jgi:hypothetical protein
VAYKIDPFLCWKVLHEILHWPFLSVPLHRGRGVTGARLWQRQPASFRGLITAPATIE